MHEDEDLEIIDHEDAISSHGPLPGDVLALARQVWHLTAEKALEKRAAVVAAKKVLEIAKQAHNSLMERCMGLACLFDKEEAERKMGNLEQKARAIDNA